MRDRCVDAQKGAGFPVAAACRAAGVTRSRYYAWAAGLPHANHHEEARLLAEIRAIHTDSHGTYGSPWVHARLRRHGWRVNRKPVERLMRVHGIVGHRPHRRRSLTKPDAGAARPAGPAVRPRPAGCGLVWGRDLDPTGEGWLDLASVLDLASRRLHGRLRAVGATALDESHGLVLGQRRR
jgi:putative transposase